MLTDWESFYVIVGSSAGALTGLMFVVISLLEGRRGASMPNELAAYGTPNVFHFCAALVIAAMLSAPWKSPTPLAMLMGISGVAGCAYAVIIFRRILLRARAPGGYNPVLEDWIWFATLPLLAYVAIFVGALMLPTGAAEPALFIIAAALVLMLLIGIHNAWDSVTYIAVLRDTEEEQQKQRELEGRNVQEH